MQFCHSCVRGSSAGNCARMHLWCWEAQKFWSCNSEFQQRFFLFLFFNKDRPKFHGRWPEDEFNLRHHCRFENLRSESHSFELIRHSHVIYLEPLHQQCRESAKHRRVRLCWTCLLLLLQRGDWRRNVNCFYVEKTLIYFVVILRWLCEMHLSPGWRARLTRLQSLTHV